MTTTRIDHTNCTHDRTPRGRAWCRDMRNTTIRAAQDAFMDLHKGLDTPSDDAYDAYYAMVDDVAFRLGVSLRDAYEIVENGPLVRK